MATYDEVKDIPNHPEVYLIDVRNRNELVETGTIPGSINIPLPELEAALQMADDEFEKAFYREKPTEERVLIFSCFMGKRAQHATNLAQSLGFEKAKAYAGSWREWAQKQGL